MDRKNLDQFSVLGLITSIAVFLVALGLNTPGSFGKVKVYKEKNTGAVVIKNCPPCLMEQTRYACMISPPIIDGGIPREILIIHFPSGCEYYLVRNKGGLVNRATTNAGVVLVDIEQGIEPPEEIKKLTKMFDRALEELHVDKLLPPYLAEWEKRKERKSPFPPRVTVYVRGTQEILATSP